MDVKIFLSSSPDEHMVPNSSQKQSVLETIIQSNLKQVLFLHYQAINWAGGIRVCAQPQQSHFSHSCCSLMTPLFGFRLGISHGRLIPEMEDPSVLAPSALSSAQELSEASLAAENRVPNNAADQSTGCHHPSQQIPPSQPCSISSAKTAAINRFKELVCLKSKTFFEHMHSTLLSGVLIKVGTSTLQIHSSLYI